MATPNHKAHKLFTLRGILALGGSFALLMIAYFYVSPQITGDEPHYLMVDQAIIHHQTFDLQAAYKNQEYLPYYPAKLDPQGDPKLISINGPHAYPMHGVGLSLFLLPGYLIASKTGAVIQMILLATATIYMVWLWTKRITGDVVVSYITAGTLLLCHFFVGLSGYLYPDMLIAAAGLLCILLLTSSQYMKPFSQVIIGGMLGFLMFVHYRNIAIAVPLLTVMGFLSWKKYRQLPWVSIAVFGCLTALFFVSQYAWFHSWNPATPYGDLTGISTRPFSNISAMLFDSSRGLFIYNPVLLLLLAGLPIWYKKHRASLIAALLVLGPSMIVLALFRQWTGGAAPTGRYMMAFLPALMPAVAFAIIQFRKTWHKVVIGLLVLLSLLITLDAVLYKFTFVDYSSVRPTSTLLQQIHANTGVQLEHFIPSFTNDTFLIGKLGLIKLAAWVGIAGSFAAYGYVSVRDKYTAVHRPKQTTASKP